MIFMSSVQIVQLLVISIVVGGVLGFLGAIPYLKKKGIDVNKVVDTTENVIKAAEPVINLVSAIAPGSKAIDILKTIEKWAVIAVGQAQQLYHAGTIKNDERKQVAENAIYKVLEELNIELTDARKDLINAAIENAVNDLGHADPTESERLAKEQATQEQLLKIQQENTNLKSTIAQFNASTSNIVQPAATVGQ